MENNSAAPLDLVELAGVFEQAKVNGMRRVPVAPETMLALIALAARAPSENAQRAKPPANVEPQTEVQPDWKRFSLSVLTSVQHSGATDFDRASVQYSAARCGLLIKTAAPHACEDNHAERASGSNSQDCYEYSPAALEAIRETLRSRIAADEGAKS